MKRHGTPTYANFNETWLFSKWTTISRSQSQLCKTTISHSQSQLCNSVVFESKTAPIGTPLRYSKRAAESSFSPWVQDPGSTVASSGGGCRISLSGNLTMCCAMLPGYPFHFSWCDDRFPLVKPKKTCGVMWSLQYLIFGQHLIRSKCLLYTKLCPILSRWYTDYTSIMGYIQLRSIMHECLSIYLQVHVHTHIIQSYNSLHPFHMPSLYTTFFNIP